MSEAGAKQWDERAELSEKRVELSEERAELLPERTTLAAVEIGRKEFYPSNVAVESPTSNNFPVGSPASNNAILANASAPEVTGGFMPILITLMPSINIIVQKSDLDDLGLGNHSDDGHADDAPVGDGHADPLADHGNANDSPADTGHTADPYAGGDGWMDFLRRMFGR
ncbi:MULTISPECIES: hypothetical protein [Pseudofrankia]|uniref:hypothetical protein n=1 Tax=Pseudofrankia TaxID=2994363 RepID=UPI000234B4F5|nr:MULTISPECIES: hypothetical protein [Pseudofrankia]OHV31049.1 hypothetical protein BCD49_32515 [Pseudofrankia sp. EUN1h]